MSLSGEAPAVAPVLPTRRFGDCVAGSCHTLLPGGDVARMTSAATVDYGRRYPSVGACLDERGAAVYPQGVVAPTVRGATAAQMGARSHRVRERTLSR
jgi:hypothetical protein